MELRYLGKQVGADVGPEEFELDRVPNPVRGGCYAARFTCPELTSLCPATGQPDFAHLIIDYVPDKWLVESKSLKLFLTSFRNHGAFHEACSMLIARKLEDLLDPAWMRVAVFWAPRGGIPIDVLYSCGDRALERLALSLDGLAYRARG